MYTCDPARMVVFQPRLMAAKKKSQNSTSTRIFPWATCRGLDAGFIRARWHFHNNRTKNCTEGFSRLRRYFLISL